MTMTVAPPPPSVDQFDLIHELTGIAIRRAQDTLLLVYELDLTDDQRHAIRLALTGVIGPLLTSPLRPKGIDISEMLAAVEALQKAGV